jgi:hypothetical protein
LCYISQIPRKGGIWQFLKTVVLFCGGFYNFVVKIEVATLNQLAAAAGKNVNKTKL